MVAARLPSLKLLPALAENQNQREVDHQRRDDVGCAISHAIGSGSHLGGDAQ